MTFFTYVGVGFVVITLCSIACGVVRGLVARHKAKKFLKKMKEI